MGVTPGETPSEEPEATFSEAAATQELNNAVRLPELELQPIRNQLLLDFYLSFRFSQGSEVVQNDLFRAVIKEYRRTGNEPTAEDLDAVQAKLASLRPPVQHTQIDESRLGEFVNMWDKLERAFRGTLGEKLHRDELLQLGAGMAERDIKFIDKGRSGRDSAADPRESFFRTYVLQETPTRSATYNSVMMQIHAACAEAKEPWRPVAQKLVELEAVWEYTHPGEKFYPEQLAEAA